MTEARRNTTIARAVERKLRDRAIGLLILDNHTVRSARRALGIDHRTGIADSIRWNTTYVLRAMKSRTAELRAWLSSSTEDYGPIHVDADTATAHRTVEQIWATAAVMTSAWSVHQMLSEELISRYNLPVPTDCADNTHDVSALEFVNVRTHERLLVYSFHRWKGTRLPHTNRGNDQWDHVGHFTVTARTQDGRFAPADLDVFGLTDRDLRFGKGSTPPAPPDHEVFETLHDVLTTRLGIIPDKSLDIVPASRRPRRLRNSIRRIRAKPKPRSRD